ncbi:protein of unknown function (plasmid) [Shinella sp. WSC3-e]|nr:hypothetical protein SHINE37_100162 [Rhizobiaceae bacterium]CAK7261708.1 protein of unknown function [Shinella sp. WSC3-e]
MPALDDRLNGLGQFYLEVQKNRSLGLPRRGRHRARARSADKHRPPPQAVKPKPTTSKAALAVSPQRAAMLHADGSFNVTPFKAEEMITALRSVLIETFGARSAFSAIINIPDCGSDHASKCHRLDLVRPQSAGTCPSLEHLGSRMEVALQKPPREVIVPAFKPEVDLVCRASIAAGNALLP